MADKINDLTAASAITESQQIEADTSGSTAEKLTIAQLRKYILNKIIVSTASTARSFALSDVSKYVRFTAGTAITATIPANATTAFTAGDEIEIQQSGVGQITITPADGVTVSALDGNLVSAGTGALIRIKYIAADVWDVMGDLVNA